MKNRTDWLALLFLLLVSAAFGAPEKAAESTSWRDRYTLGPGDLLNFALYGRPEFVRNDIVVQPDGNISYLQAANIHAAGLTITELRAKFEEVLGQYYRRPLVIIAPSELRSKKYFVIGKVVNNGAFPMDRPITLMEALARANGLDTGIIEEKTVELADLAHSILMRNGQRVPVDFEKLFWKGDMSQNIEIEPNDYLHIASAGSNDVYVLGEVQRPGRQGFIGDLTVLGAIAARGGYSKAAYRERVLVVRGSLAHPQLFAINTNDVLKGRTANFRLQPKDIVYVNARPWQAAEMLVDLAVTTFFQGAASAWANRDIPMLITAPLLPQTATGRERASQLR